MVTSYGLFEVLEEFALYIQCSIGLNPTWINTIELIDIEGSRRLLQ